MMQRRPRGEHPALTIRSRTIPWRRFEERLAVLAWADTGADRTDYP
ncbi:hypothetical protein SGL43_03930 [Streptomyces globisporus]|uniref:IS5/IS1182 family transposase n=1 Tax=Streptomyces globisporus TaxID=1908 RepID=A0ABN8V5S8_STRGL|nr:hypothetical protein SGL43_03930 [Streptomyces globisporus]